jgi:hypothetical protein
MPKMAVNWSPQARADLRAIDRETALQILRAIDRYLSTGAGDVKKLQLPRREFRLTWATTESSLCRERNSPSKSCACVIPVKPTVEELVGRSFPQWAVVFSPPEAETRGYPGPALHRQHQPRTSDTQRPFG